MATSSRRNDSIFHLHQFFLLPPHLPHQCSYSNELRGGVKRGARPLGGDYTSSPPPRQRRLIDALLNLQGSKGEESECVCFGFFAAFGCSELLLHVRPEERLTRADSPGQSSAPAAKTKAGKAKREQSSADTQTWILNSHTRNSYKDPLKRLNTQGLCC